MKSVYFLIILSIISCKGQDTNCVYEIKGSMKQGAYKVNMDDFNLYFINVLTVNDDNQKDFHIEKENNTVILKKNFLESDNLYEKKFLIESNNIDNLKVVMVSKNDYVFYGNEKKYEPLNLSQIDSIVLNCHEKIYDIPKPKSNLDYEFVKKKSYEKYINYNKEIVASKKLSDKEIQNASNLISTFKLNDVKNLDELLVSYENIEFELIISYTNKVTNEELTKKIVFINIKSKENREFLHSYSLDIDNDGINDKIMIYENENISDNYDRKHFGLPILIKKGLNSNNFEFWKNNKSVIFSHSSSGCISEGFDTLVTKDNFFTIQQQSCRDDISVYSYTTFVYKQGEIYLHKYGEEYFDNIEHNKKIPTKIWTSKDFGQIKFEDVTEKFLLQIRQNGPK